MKKKLKDLNKKVTSNKTKHLLVKNEFKKLQTFDSSLFIGQNYFNNGGAQLFLLFQLIYKTISTLLGLPDTIFRMGFQGIIKWKIYTSLYSKEKSFSKTDMDEWI